MNCCSSSAEPCCMVEAVVSVDERGQMVLPKELRKKLVLEAGQKLALVTWGKTICLIKADEFNAMAQTMLGPMIEELRK